jgi:hypothetical protein
MDVKDLVNGRTGLGGGIGAIVGFFFGGPIGSGVCALMGMAIANVTPSNRKGVMTPKRQLIYESAIASTKSPDDLRALADAFDGEGLKPWAEMLRKRAALRELPQATRNARRAVFREAMASDNPDGIDKTAESFEHEGAVDAAKALRDHANAVRAAHSAGKSAKPMADGQMLDSFADKLAKALIHFGPASEQAKSAAANFVRARGGSPNEANVSEVIAIAHSELGAGGDVAAPGSGESGEQSPAVELPVEAVSDTVHVVEIASVPTETTPEAHVDAASVETAE